MKIDFGTVCECRFEKKIEPFDLIITGEGCTDAQTLQGKAPMECIDRAILAHKKVLLISGKLGAGYSPLAQHEGVIGLVECGRKPDPKTALMEKTKQIMDAIRSSPEKPSQP